MDEYVELPMSDYPEPGSYEHDGARFTVAEIKVDGKITDTFAVSRGVPFAEDSDEFIWRDGYLERTNGAWVAVDQAGNDWRRQSSRPAKAWQLALTSWY